MDWKDFWFTFPENFPADEFIKQVGKTFQGKPISDEQLSRLISSVIQTLDINQSDYVLELCCGNGLISSAVGKKCKRMIGVDFSRPIIENARQYHCGSNITFFEMSILDITPEKLSISEPFTKIYMYEGLQHLEKAELAPLLETLLSLSAAQATILLASVPDKDKFKNFYCTPELLRDYRRRKRRGILALGTWWKKSFILKTCHEYGLQCEILPQPEGFHTAHYRFDVRITKK